MVNEKAKSKIYKLLRQADSPLSGEILSQELGISRVAVWKHIAKMKEHGCPIEAGGRGYSLLSESDLLRPWNLETGFLKVRHFSSVTSTMDKAREELKRENDTNVLILSDEQTCGRGRHGRTWESGLGGLYMTIMLKPEFPLRYCHLYSFAASTVLAETLADIWKINAAVKWPNDILVDGKKIGGVLIEAGGEIDNPHYLHLGIGINVINKITNIEIPGCSLQDCTIYSLSRKEVLEAYLKRLLPALFNLKPEEILSRWRKQNTTINRKIQIKSPLGNLTGIARDINRDGALILESEDGMLTPVYAGDCRYL